MSNVFNNDEIDARWKELCDGEHRLEVVKLFPDHALVRNKNDGKWFRFRAVQMEKEYGEISTLDAALGSNRGTWGEMREPARPENMV